MQYEKGDEVPAELLEAAKEAGCVSGKKGDSKPSEDPLSDNKQDGGAGNETNAQQTGEGEGQGEGQDGTDGSQQTEQQ
ncbi:hypothetical protein [Neisseria subflava]|uniref:hypothetical protein n=1 Tax=Neisseria subflava TaxID=28449 RepID=UPI00202A3099|nr:hypothetical protein [Neisseria subflava]MCL9777654.1 hypothetical protein [Neisseria subflava]